MKKISDLLILEKKALAIKHSDEQFDLEEIVGKTIVERRRIKNPQEYNPENEVLNPEFFNVLIFHDNTFLLTEMIGDGECAVLHAYLYDGHTTYYSTQLF